MNKNFEELLIKIEERVHEKLPEDVTLSPVNQKLASEDNANTQIYLQEHPAGQIWNVTVQVTVLE